MWLYKKSKPTKVLAAIGMEKMNIKMALIKLNLLLKLLKNNFTSKLVCELMSNSLANNGKRSRGLLEGLALITNREIFEKDKLHKIETSKIKELNMTQRTLEYSDEINMIRNLLENRNEDNNKKLKSIILDFTSEN